MDAMAFERTHWYVDHTDQAVNISWHWQAKGYGTEAHAMSVPLPVWDWLTGSNDDTSQAEIRMAADLVKPGYDDNTKPRYSVGDLHGTPVVWEYNEFRGRPDPRPLRLERIAEMLNERASPYVTVNVRVEDENGVEIPLPTPQRTVGSGDTITIQVPSCPDGGTCHHKCTVGCWRVQHAEPLSHVYVDDEWPQSLRYLPNDGKL